jgi:hypothetical protein
MSRWSTLDRIVSVEPGQSASAIRNVPNTLDDLRHATSRAFPCCREC